MRKKIKTIDKTVILEPVENISANMVSDVNQAPDSGSAEESALPDSG